VALIADRVEATTPRPALGRRPALALRGVRNWQLTTGLG
jgi:hypothetical protein